MRRMARPPTSSFPSPFLSPNDPPGVFNCPAELQIIPFLCGIFEADPYNFFFNGTIPLTFRYVPTECGVNSLHWMILTHFPMQSPLALASLASTFSDYFTTYWNKTEFLSAPYNNVLGTETPILPDLNNLGHTTNASYVAALASIKYLVLSEALQDTVVYPFQSEQFGSYAWTDAAGKSKPITLEFNDTRNDQWATDALGLRTRAQQAPDSLILSSFEGDHIRFSDAYWDSEILPYLD